MVVRIREFRDEAFLINSMNKFEKEYVSGRKDQFDVDYAIFRKSVEETDTRDELIKFLEDRFAYVISKIADQNVRELMEELELI